VKHSGRNAVRNGTESGGSSSASGNPSRVSCPQLRIIMRRPLGAARSSRSLSDNHLELPAAPDRYRITARSCPQPLGGYDIALESCPLLRIGHTTMTHELPAARNGCAIPIRELPEAPIGYPITIGSCPQLRLVTSHRSRAACPH
jgi:hypothetical protein